MVAVTLRMERARTRERLRTREGRKPMNSDDASRKVLKRVWAQDVLVGAEVLKSRLAAAQGMAAVGVAAVAQGGDQASLHMAVIAEGRHQPPARSLRAWWRGTL